MAPTIITDSQQVLDIFQPGLERHAEALSYDPVKKFLYVQHPTKGWRVYLRTACFVHELNKPFDANRFLVVKRTGGDPLGTTWEPPKGQMEGKDGLETKTIFQILRENIQREVFEEAKISNIRNLQHTGLVVQSKEPGYPPNTFFQYHIFSGFAHHMQIEGAFNKFKWIKENPAEFAKQRRDYREKDDIAWYDLENTKIMGKWSPTIIEMYLNTFRG